ncbi:MAG TPA: glycine dehydrogenase (aminomethyl-transferring) [Bacteroidaceae bacterium]|nr:glycine dehydrogenase (aminomethyl-transferring) [Bacteroidaceae bacterium]
MISENFTERHIGPEPEDVKLMLEKIGVKTVDELIAKTIPRSIIQNIPLHIREKFDERNYLNHIRELAEKNKLFHSYIGLGYYNTVLPAVIQRNMLENPNWYTSYTPYQAEISQGRLEALLNFQTVIMELTGMEIANSSLLDETTAAAEAMIMLFNARSRDDVKEGKNRFFVDEHIFPQTMAVIETRAEPLGIEIIKGDYRNPDFDGRTYGCLVQFPSADGEIRDYKKFTTNAKELGIAVTVAADLMSLVLLSPPGAWGADVVIGSSQRFGISMFYGGPHAGYFATKEAYKRHIPGRIIGVSVDDSGKPALRMALQTREQHIKRERATSNICTAQALLANMAGMYAVYHGPEGLKRIAGNIHAGALYLSEKLIRMGYVIKHENFFDTLLIKLPDGITAEKFREEAEAAEMNFYFPDNSSVQLSTDETTGEHELNTILELFARVVKKAFSPSEKIEIKTGFANRFARKSEILKQEVFHRYHSETELMRYIRMLERKDISLTHSMISLGSCTMKLNAAAHMMPVSWPAFANIHPFVPVEQTEGYHQLISELEHALQEITGFEKISFQPNSGAAGEYTGLMVIRAYQKKNGEGHRNVVLIPASAHGTNPASAVMAGMIVRVVDCDEQGNIKTEHLRGLVQEFSKDLSAIMITYPSTHGVFEENITEIVNIVHEHGGQVYMDGANMNAQVGLTNPASIGADVCHLNLHKTFAIPHGGGGPGVGPIGVARHLVEFLPTHPLIETGGIYGINSVAGAPYGSAGILPISHAYIQMLGAEGLTYSTKIAILNANYIAASLKDYYGVLYKGKYGFVAHEMILECRNFKAEADITEADIAKRLMDYGFHAPTLSFPVHGTLMVEPTESESKAELDRFIDAMIDIHKDIMAIKSGKADRENNVLKNAPHTSDVLVSDDWDRPYSRAKAVFPLDWVRNNKFWPPVSRINDGYGDRNLVCSCEPLESYRVG